VERVKMKPRVIQGVVGRTKYFQWNLVVHFVCSFVEVYNSVVFSVFAMLYTGSFLIC